MSERRIIAQHAGTVLVGQLAVMAFGITDTLVAGRYDTQALAALSVGSAIYITVYVALMGVLQALLPILAEHHGAKRHLAVGTSFRQALYLCGLGSILGIAVLLSPDLIFSSTQTPQVLRSEVRQYLALLALALPPALWFRMFSTLNQSLGKPEWVTWIQIAGLVIKIPLSIVLTFGSALTPALGLVGCACATLVVNVLMGATAVYLLKTQALYRLHQLWKKPEPPNPAVIRQLLKLGIPNGLSITVEVSSFTLMALFIARLGTQASASHQITASMAALMYMVPLSWAIATSARVSYWIGAEQASQVRQAMRLGFEMTLCSAALMSAGLWLGRESIAQLYAQDPEVVRTGAALLGWLALYHLVDAIQALCFFLLRCFRITLAPLLIYSVLLWGVGLWGGYVWAYVGMPLLDIHPQPESFWISSTLALTLTASLLLMLLWVNAPQKMRWPTHRH